MPNRKLRIRHTIALAIMLGIFAVMTVLFASKNFEGMTPNLVFTASADVACMFCIAIFFYGAGKNDFTKRHTQMLTNMVIVIFFAVVCDMFSVLLQGNPQNNGWIAIAMTTMLIMINCCSLSFYFFARAVVNAKKRYGPAMAILWFFIADIIYIANLHTHFMFEVSQNGYIVINSGYNLYMVYPIITQISALVLAYKYNIPKKQRYIFYCFNIIPLLSSYLFSILIGPNVTFAGMCAALIVCYNVYFVELERENDSLKESFERFLSDDVVNNLINTSNGELSEPIMQMATIMNVDIRGFTAISQRLYPSRLVDMINHYFGVMNEIVENNGGTVLEFLGDGFTAVFGAPVYINHFAERAIAAAMQMQNAIASINEWNSKQGYPPIEIGVGINTGEIILGSFGSSNKACYKAIGEEADFAGYIESQSVGGSILISKSTMMEVRTENDATLIYDCDSDGNDKAKLIYRIRYLGAPYNLKVEDEEAEPVALVQPYPVSFRRFKGKSIKTETYSGVITHASEKKLIIESDAAVENGEEIDLSDKNYKYLYAKKVVDNNRNTEYILISKPADFKKWLVKLMNYGNSAMKE